MYKKTKAILLVVGMVALLIILAIVFGGANNAGAQDIVNPHPTPPANSVTNAMLKSNAVQDNVVATNAGIQASKIATSTSQDFVNDATETYTGNWQFTQLPTVPTSTPSNNTQVVSYGFLSANAVTLATTSHTPTISVPVVASSVSFSYSGAIASWTVPTVSPYTLSNITIHATGGAGGGGANGGGAGGSGDSVTGTISLTPGTVLWISVGNSGGGSSYNSCASATFNGGGVACSGGGAGGGYTLIANSSTFTTSTILMLAAGGGGAGAGASNPSGTAAFPSGNTGSIGYTGNTGGVGGTQSAGGSGGTGDRINGVAGSFMQGGSAATSSYNIYGGGGGGGGGIYGGGGGGSTSNQTQPSGAGGGGGASYVNSLLISTSTSASNNTGAGSLVISYTENPTITGNDFGGQMIIPSTLTTGTIMFGTQFNSAPGCNLMPSMSARAYGSSTASQLNFTFTQAVTTGSYIGWVCI